MKKFTRLPIFLAAAILLLLSTCTRKDLELDVRQRGCSLFKIDLPEIEILSDPSCTGTPLVASYKISFHYHGSEECLHRIVIDPETIVSDSTGNAMDSALYAMEFLETSPLVEIDRSERRISFQFDIVFPNADVAMAYNNALIVFHCENTEGMESKSAKVSIYGRCSAPPVDLDDPVSTITINDSIIRVKLWDNADEDGDIVSVYLNGEWVLQQYTLTNAGKTFYWPIHSGTNDLILVANNEGTSGPNTCSISINGKFSKSIAIDLETGAVIRIL